MHLMKADIDKSVYQGNGKTRDIRWDDDPRGLGLRVYPSGKKAFILSYRAKGKQRMLTLGTYGVITLSQARSIAKQRLGVVESGADPVQERAIARADEAASKSVTELCQKYLENHAKVHKKRSWRDDEQRINKYILPNWGTFKARDITRSHAAQLLLKIGEHSHYAANRTLENVSKMFKLAETWGYVPEGFLNPVRGLAWFKEKSRDRWITDEEMPRLAAAIAEEKNVYVKAAIWLYLLTGMRKQELLRAQWADINWTRNEIRLPETKNGRVHYIPLSVPAQIILKELPRQLGNPHILAGRGGNLVSLRKPWVRIRKTAGIEDVRLHDLRRTVGSWLAQRGKSLQLIGKVLNHADIKSTLVYARLADNQARAALEEHASALHEAVGENLLRLTHNESKSAC